MIQAYQVILLEVKDRLYAIEISEVKEIIRNAKTEQLPDQPALFEGVINLRGQFLPVMDLAKRFLLGEAENSINQRIVVVMIDGRPVGLRVDAVYSIDTIHATDDLSDHLEKVYIKQHFIKAISDVDGKLTIILDVSQIFNEIEMEFLQAVQEHSETDG